jgi:hypothetical protein
MTSANNVLHRIAATLRIGRNRKGAFGRLALSTGVSRQ